MGTMKYLMPISILIWLIGGSLAVEGDYKVIHDEMCKSFGKRILTRGLVDAKRVCHQNDDCDMLMDTDCSGKRLTMCKRHLNDPYKNLPAAKKTGHCVHVKRKNAKVLSSFLSTLTIPGKTNWDKELEALRNQGYRGYCTGTACVGQGPDIKRLPLNDDKVDTELKALRKQGYRGYCTGTACVGQGPEIKRLPLNHDKVDKELKALRKQGYKGSCSGTACVGQGPEIKRLNLNDDKGY